MGRWHFGKLYNIALIKVPIVIPAHKLRFRAPELQPTSCVRISGLGLVLVASGFRYWGFCCRGQVSRALEGPYLLQPQLKRSRVFLGYYNPYIF